MSVSYFDEIATAKPLTLLKLLFCKWKGSVLKLLWKDLLVFFAIFLFLQLIYRFALNEYQQKVFETICVHGQFYQEKTPLSFLLGFFVGNVFDLWWSQWNNVPWPTTLAIHVSTNLHGFDEVGRAMRRTIMRYVCLSATMVFRTLAPRVKKRFPRMDDLIKAGLINEDELAVLQGLDKRFPGYGKYWLPICWAASLATKARDEGRIRDDFALKTIIDGLNNFRSNCGSLMNYAYVYIPLVQVQVVAIAVYTYFLAALFAYQHTKISKHYGFLLLEHIPIVVFLKFIFYMGWLKVAETMMNPFGTDDDDFDVNSMIDRNLQTSYIIVDEMHADHPELLKDCYWNEIIPQELPDLGRGMSVLKRNAFLGDVFNVDEFGSRKNVSIEINSVEKDTSLQSLKPRSDVFDETYRRIISSQTSLEKEMERIRNNLEELTESEDDEFELKEE